MTERAIPTLQDYAVRILRRVEHRPGPLDTPCWIWQGAVNSAGYGIIAIRLAPFVKRVVTVHRFMYRYSTQQPIPEKVVIGHRCDTKACTNPAHLETITHGQNIRDAWARGRYARRKLAPSVLTLLDDMRDQHRETA